MAVERITCDLAIPKEIADKPAVRAKLVELYQLMKLAKSYSVKINEGQPNEEMTVKASWHTCYHDEPNNDIPCEEREI